MTHGSLRSEHLVVLSRLDESIWAFSEQVRQVHHTGHVGLVGDPTQDATHVPCALNIRLWLLASVATRLYPSAPS